MKKMVLGLSMSLAALVFLVSPATAANRPQGPPALNAFLASLAGPAPVEAAKRPILEKSACSATANCWDGGTVSCSGNSSCTAVDGDCSVNEPGHVVCDGIPTNCPNACPCGANFCDDRESNCALSCDPCTYTFTCDPVACTSHCHCNFSTCPQ